jgi:hypothetical protein
MSVTERKPVLGAEECVFYPCSEPWSLSVRENQCVHSPNEMSMSISGKSLCFPRKAERACAWSPVLKS